MNAKSPFENNAFLSFKGAIGRKWFVLHSLSSLLIPVVLIGPIFLFSRFGASPGNLSREGIENATNSLGLAIIIPWTILNLVGAVLLITSGIGLQVRRARDIFHQKRSHIFLEAVGILFFYLTKGFFGLGALALIVWPGMLYKSSQSQKLSSSQT
ncbi:MAG: hypothetical protein AB7G93_23270 [Bdellovibrionales bacterium]